MERWYVLHTKPHADHQVRAFLQRHDLQVYVPEIESRAGTALRRELLFPSYVFVRVDLSQMRRSILQYAPGTLRLISFGGVPVPLADDVIRVIQLKVQQLKEIVHDSPITHPFKPGDSVRIRKGPFQNFLAIFEGESTPTERVNVLLTFLGRVSRLSVEVANLEPASEVEQDAVSKRPRRTRGRGRAIKS